MNAPDSGPVETELKLVLDDRTALGAVLAHLGPEREALEQRNVYFDDPDGAWKAAGFAVRLRAEGGEHRLTVKTKGRDDGDFVARGEWEATISADEAARWADDGDALVRAVADLLGRHGATLPPELAATTLEVSGSMRNLRRRAGLPGFDALTVEADETTYPNGDVRFEIELEVPDAAKARDAVDALRAVFERAGVPWRPSKVSKRERLERVLRGESA